MSDKIHGMRMNLKSGLPPTTRAIMPLKLMFATIARKKFLKPSLCEIRFLFTNLPVDKVMASTSNIPDKKESSARPLSPT